MQFTDVVAGKCEVYVTGLNFSDYVRSQDVQLGQIVIELLWSSGIPIEGLNAENLGDYFTIDDSSPKQVRITVKPTSNVFKLEE